MILTLGEASRLREACKEVPTSVRMYAVRALADDVVYGTPIDDNCPNVCGLSPLWRQMRYTLSRFRFSYWRDRDDAIMEMIHVISAPTA